MLRDINSNSVWTVLTNITHWCLNKADTVTNIDKPDSVCTFNPLPILLIHLGWAQPTLMAQAQHNQSDRDSEPCLPSDRIQSSPASHRPLHWDTHKVPPTTLSSLRLWLGTDLTSTCSGLCEEWCPLIQICCPLFNQHISGILDYFLFKSRY